MNREEFQHLIERYTSGSLTAAEEAMLAEILQDEQHIAMLNDIMDEQLHQQRPEAWHFPEVIESVQGRMKAAMQARIRQIRPWRWAAAILLLIATGAYFWMSRQEDHPANTVEKVNIQPGKNGAVLTLADGSQVSLDTVQNGVVALQGGATARVVNGALQYEGSAGQVLYNTMTTPRGRQFNLRLPDGTEVWLNSASSIRFPMTFDGQAREVSITGEAYFEVAKDAHQPFRIKVDDRAEVLVLGTHFNINAYRNEQTVRTTLLEGAVKVSGRNIKPGEQAIVRGNGVVDVLQDVDVEKVTAWKNGFFDFNNAQLEEVMRQLERWYDIEVAYEGKMPAITFWGAVPRDQSLADVLLALEKAGVHFRVAGRKLIVHP